MHHCLKMSIIVRYILLGIARHRAITIVSASAVSFTIGRSLSLQTELNATYVRIIRSLEWLCLRGESVRVQTLQVIN